MAQPPRSRETTIAWVGFWAHMALFTVSFCLLLWIAVTE